MKITQFFIRTKNQEAFVQASSMGEAFVHFVKETAINDLGAILIGHTEYFPRNQVPSEAIGIRVTIPLVLAGIWTKEQAEDLNEMLIGSRIV